MTVREMSRQTLPENIFLNSSQNYFSHNRFRQMTETGFQRLPLLIENTTLRTAIR